MRGFEINLPRFTKQRVAIGVIVVSFLGLVVASVVDQGAGTEFVVILSVFCIMVIALSPWVLGN